MKLFKWTDNLKPKFPDIIENLFGKKIKDEVANGESVSNVPAVNVETGDSKYDIEFAVPGLNKKDIKINLKGNVLTVSSEKQYSNKEKKRDFVRQEFAYAAFSRSFSVPEGINPDDISAKLNKGILKISLPVKNQIKTNVKQIKVN
ncbi:MAG: Hsp20/alpha crystallin family protein [Saprospiraceae bacterium]|nr:Hsp20/alpha crystallin family protein [Saprospiraceae bacterium]